jgi:hypothetical protein
VIPCDEFEYRENKIEDILAKCSKIVCHFVDSIGGTGALKQGSQLGRWQSVQ